MSVPNVKRQAGLAALCILAATCTSASAADLARCEGTSGTSHSWERGYRDLGGGYVAYYDHFVVVEPGMIISGRTQFIEGCASGKGIEVPAFYCADENDGTCNAKASYVFSDEIDAILKQAAGLEPTTFDALAARLKKISPETLVHPGSEDGVESCACHVAYPRLRGDKQKFSFTRD